MDVGPLWWLIGIGLLVGIFTVAPERAQTTLLIGWLIVVVFTLITRPAAR